MKIKIYHIENFEDVILKGDIINGLNIGYFKFKSLNSKDKDMDMIRNLLISLSSAGDKFISNKIHLHKLLSPEYFNINYLFYYRKKTSTYYYYNGYNIYEFSSLELFSDQIRYILHNNKKTYDKFVEIKESKIINNESSSNIDSK